jgi:2-keto-4-pentenoate hydratase
VSGVLADPRIARGMERQTALRRSRLAAGAKIVGWKVGFGATAAQEKLRLTKPLVGFLLDAALLPNDADVSLRGWLRPAAEPEIAVYLARGVDAGADEQSARAAIGALGPAIELADVDCPVDDVEAVLACDIFQRHVVLGPRDATRAGARLAGLTGRVVRSGNDIAVPPDLESNTGRIVDIVRHVADVAVACGESLRAGQFIIAGSVTPPLSLDASDSALTFALEPIGKVSIRLTQK